MLTPNEDSWLEELYEDRLSTTEEDVDVNWEEDEEEGIEWARD
jgi:hypothetical protein